MIQNNGKDTSDWNKFIVKLFLNESYFTKAERFLTQHNIYTYMCVSVSECVCVCSYIRVYLCVNICAHVCTYARVCHSRFFS